mmetsp:Transcript_5963/g.13173  ORF Transcript_5963/g.13173 Transcript_5963/m.13173 type:complete len:171 (+) Transcript_5963:77-589(+)
MSTKPAWTDSSAPAAPAAAGDVESDGGVVGPAHKKKFSVLLVTMNMGSSIFMAATGALSMATASGINDTGLIFVGLYIMIFSAIIFLYELAQLSKWEKFDSFMKKNFGFLYGVIGKSAFLAFTAILCFGLKQPVAITVSCGIIVSAWAVLQILVFFKFPEYFDVKEKYQP